MLKPLIDVVIEEDDVRHHVDTEFPNMKFMKNGSDIIKSVQVLIVKAQKDLEVVKGKVSEIAKARGVEADEVIDAGRDEERISTYSNKFSDNVERAAGIGSRAKDALDALRKDLQALRTLSHEAADVRDDITTYQRVAAHTDPKGLFNLTYNELRELGFD